MRDEFLAQLDAEIEAAQASLRFWRKQQEAHAGSELAVLVSAAVDSHQAQLSHLERTRVELSAL